METQVYNMHDLAFAASSRLLSICEILNRRFGGNTTYQGQGTRAKTQRHNIQTLSWALLLVFIQVIAPNVAARDICQAPNTQHLNLTLLLCYHASCK